MLNWHLYRDSRIHRCFYSLSNSPELKESSITLDSDLSEVTGLLLGDGCLSRFTSGGRVLFEVAFTGNRSEFGYYRDFVKPTLERRFQLRGQLQLRSYRTVRLHFRSGRIVQYFSCLGVPVGKKHDATIPIAILQDLRLLKSFIRGLYHAEGSFYRRYSKMYKGHSKIYSHLMVVQFRTKLHTLMIQVHDSLQRLRIRTTKLSGSNGVFTFRLTDQKEIAKFFTEVKPRFKCTPPK